MFTEDFEKRILLEPASKNGLRCNHLRIVTAFTDVERISKHLLQLFDGIKKKEYVSNIKVDIILGMTKGTGLTEKKHKKLCERIRWLNSVIGMPKVTCRYVVEGKQVHSKVYVWSKGHEVKVAYSGSANYSMNAFFVRRECMDECNAKEALRYYRSIFKDTMDCFCADLKDKLTFAVKRNVEEDIEVTNLENLSWENYENTAPEEQIFISLLKANGQDTGYGSGVNWGIRKNGYKRNRNQAYIPYNVKDRKQGFFPMVDANGTYPVFKVIIKGYGAFYMRQAQAGGKALETPESNAIIGEWLRKEVGVPDGTYITKDMLEHSKGTKVLFKKFSDGIYTLEYSGEK